MGHGIVFFLCPAILISDSSLYPSLPCLKNIQCLRCLYFCTLNSTTVTLIYCSFLKSQINRLQQIQNCLARTVVKPLKSSHITPILRSLHWLKINESIEYKLLSLTYKVLTTSQPDYLHNLISVQSTGRTCSSSLVTLARPSVSSSLQITNRSFTYASPYQWNQLLSSFRQKTSLCSLSSWLTSSCAYHLITVTTFSLTIYHYPSLSLQT